MAPHADYTASKWALEGMSEVLAQEVRPFGIRVAIIEPGVIATPIFGKMQPREWSSYYPQSRRMLALFKASLQNPVPPSIVGDKIAEIVNRRDSTLRHLVGPDANGFIAWRASMTDEQWIAWNSVDSDEEWRANVKRDFGLDVGQM